MAMATLQKECINIIHQKCTCCEGFSNTLQNTKANFETVCVNTEYFGQTAQPSGDGKSRNTFDIPNISKWLKTFQDDGHSSPPLFRSMNRYAT